jgi:hypothetical protein
VNTLETSIRRLTQPVNGQFPRPWMTDMERPEKARIFIVGANQATPFPAALVEGHEAYIDALFNRNGKSCRKLYEEMRGHEGPSQTRKNIDALRAALANVGVNDVLETNVICYSTPMSSDLAHKTHQGGKAAGRAIFLALLDIIRPVALIAHGAGTNKELARVLCTNLPSPPLHHADGVARARVQAQLRGEAYAPMIFVIPSLAPPKWNGWQKWAQPHLAEVCSEVRKFLDEDFQRSQPDA